MSLPPGITTVTVQGRYRHPDGTPFKGTVSFFAPAIIQLAGAETIVAGTASAGLDTNGEFSLTLVATDNDQMQPTGWVYTVTESFEDGVAGRTYFLALPTSSPVVVLAAAAPADPAQSTYVPVAGARGNSILNDARLPVAGDGVNGDFWIDTTTTMLYGPKAAGAWPGTGVSLIGQGLSQAIADSRYDALGAAAAAQTAAATDATTKANAAQSAATTAAATDATTKVNAHRDATDPHGDRAYAVGLFVPQAQITIAQLFAQDPFYIAHRGGGANFPEHTIAAWDSALAAGAQAIEVSCHVSADGVLFCMHDTTLDRVTNGTWTGSNATWTWAALQQKAKVVSSALLGPGWADQPIPTLREVLDRYLGKVVIFLEAKSSGAVVPVQTMLGRFKGANQSVVWKNYYLSNSFSWAKTNQYKTWGYIDATTTSAQMDAVEANIDYWGVPIDSTDAEFQMVLGRATFKPVITWAVWRRAERDRVVNFAVVNGGTARHVQGIMCSEFLYTPRTTAIDTADAFAKGVRAPGQIAAVKEDATYALKFDTANSAAYCPATSGHGVVMGNYCPVAPGTNGYKITFDMMWPVLPTGTLHAGLWFAAADDTKHQFTGANAVGAYRMELRPNSGLMQLYTVAAAATSGVQVGADVATSGALVAGTWYSYEIEVNATSVVLRRTDSTGWSNTFANTAYRGLYFGIHNGSLTDVTTLPRYKNLKVVAL